MIENEVPLGRIYYNISFLFKIAYLVTFLSEEAFLTSSWSSFKWINIHISGNLLCHLHANGVYPTKLYCYDFYKFIPS